MESQLTKLNMAMSSDLVAELSHEFQTPLSILLGNLELLENEGEVRNRRALRVMRATVDRLSRLVSRMLESARLNDAAHESGTMVVSVSVLLEAVYDECTVLADQRGVLLALTGSVPNTFRGDQDQMKEVLMNLVANALQHTKRGGMVTLSARLSAGQIEMTVGDTGCGIAAADLPYVFDRFYRIGERVPGALGDIDARGTGLGLAICRQIVEAHGGTIGVESETGKGSKFTVRLPLGPSISSGA
jgi:two-component system sensor histidine kinase ResE